MKNSKNRLSKFMSIALMVLAMVCTTGLYAQSPPGGATNTVDVPLDGGLIALVIGAAAYGAKKLYDKKE